jgi:hypothetical protein
MRANFSQVSSATTGQVVSDAQRHQHAFIENLDPATAVLGLVAADIEADDLGAAQAAREAEQEHGAIAQAAQGAAVERLQHGDQILGQHRLLLPGRGGVGVADAGHDGGDMAVLTIERLAALSIVPGQRGEAALDRRHGVRLLVAGRLSRSAGGDVEADHLRIGRHELKTLAPAPGGKMPPVGRVGTPCIGRTRRLDVIAGTAGEFFQMRRQSWGSVGRGRGGGVFPFVSFAVWRLAHLHDDIDDVGQIVTAIRIGLLHRLTDPISQNLHHRGRCTAILREVRCSPRTRLSTAKRPDAPAPNVALVSEAGGGQFIWSPDGGAGAKPGGKRIVLAHSFNISYIPFNAWRLTMPTHTASATETDERVARTRNRLVLEQARAVGLLGAAKNTRLSGRVPSELIEAAKRRAHVTSDTELLELALSRLALEDDFGARLVGRKGSIPADIDLGV